MTERSEKELRYADVAVDVPGARPVADSRPAAFTYGIPERLRGGLEPGQLVWVPFGRRRLQGVVVRLTDSTELDQVREVLSRVDGRPAILAADLALARWIHREYLAPLFDALKLLLPPGGIGRRELRYRRTDRRPRPEVLADDPEMARRQREILALFGRQRSRSLDEIADAVDRAREPLDKLVTAGLLVASHEDIGPRVQPRRDRVARLTVTDPAEVERRLRALRDAPRADVLAYLRRPDVVMPSSDAVLESVGCGRSVLRRLERDDLIRLSPGGRRISPTAEGCAMTRASDTSGPTDASPPDEPSLDATPNGSATAPGLSSEPPPTLSSSPAQWRLLRVLVESDRPIPVGEARRRADVSAGVERRLVERGLARIHESSETVAPTARGARLRSAERAARHVDRHHAAVDYLDASGGAALTADIVRDTEATSPIIRELEEAGIVALGRRRVWRDPLGDTEVARAHPLPLTEDQAQVWSALAPLLRAGPTKGGAEPDGPRPRSGPDGEPADLRETVTLLHGVTGSGKTELYLRALREVLEQGRQAIVLVPEISLTAQTVRRFAERFPGQVGLWHSQLSDGERLDTWERARAGELGVIVGSRSAVFAPVPHLGLIVLDEEHAEAYKQARTPRYHARDVAIRRAVYRGAHVILGSATPSLESMWAARNGRYGLQRLPRRIVTRAPRALARAVGDAPSGGGPVAMTDELPPVEIVDMRAELRAGNTSIFSRPLARALERTLEAGEQAILFLNRRGAATFVLCRDCGHTMTCPNCSVPLTWHAGAARGRLQCHHCNHGQSAPMLCPECGSERIRYFGAGTQRVERATHERFPEARTIRWDADTTTKRGSHQAILARFAGGGADVLIGTQMIGKGLDLPLVTLVGVISADTALHFPDFRAAERAFQRLVQVAGRAGRSEHGGEVYFQTYSPDHPAIVAAARHDVLAFYRREIAFRKQHGYPPIRRLIQLTHVTERGQRAAQRAAEELAGDLRHAIDRLGLPDTDILGPAPAFFRRERGRARWKVTIRSTEPHALVRAVSIPRGWRLDVDPLDVL